jgi:hypothetical protein
LGVSGARRTLVLVAVMAIHLIFVGALIEAFRQQKLLYAAQNIVPTLIYFPAMPRRATASVQARTVRRPSAKSALLPGPLPQAPPQVSSEPAQTERPIDWGANAHQAARDVLRDESIDLQRSSKMGDGWLLAQEGRHHREPRPQPFPWSHQPLTSWFDIDPDSFVIIFRLGRRCQVVYFAVVAALGCTVGHLDPEPGRSDLFDPKYGPRPLELPEPAIPLGLPTGLPPAIDESANH